jgi:hypothetical protein
MLFHDDEFDPIRQADFIELTPGRPAPVLALIQ